MKFVCGCIVSSIGQTDHLGPYLMTHAGRKRTSVIAYGTAAHARYSLQHSSARTL